MCNKCGLKIPKKYAVEEYNIDDTFMVLKINNNFGYASLSYIKTFSIFKDKFKSSFSFFFKDSPIRKHIEKRNYLDAQFEFYNYLNICK